MKKLLLISLIGALTLIISFKTYSQTTNENPSTSVEFEFNCVSANNADWNTPLVTYKSNIYLGFIDNNRRLVIAKKNTTTNRVQTSVILSNMENDLHYAPSIGIDNKGYIHVMAGMHHSKNGSSPNKQPVPGYAWQYWKSNKAEDISNFSFMGNQPSKVPNADQISYPFLASDRNEVLYVAYRAASGITTKFVPGVMSGQVARYNSNAETWTVLGGVVPGSKESSWRAVAWENAGSNGTGYQGYKMQLYFDVNNRMHLAYSVNTDNSGSSSMHYTNATDVIYAYSDDGGVTWRKANGQKVSLPITHKDADVVYHTSPGTAWYKVDFSADKNGHPHLFFYAQGNEKRSYWNGNSWTKPENVPDSYMSNATGYAFDKGNMLTYIKSGRVNRTADFGKTVKRYEFKDSDFSGNPKLDVNFLHDNNQIRASGLGSNNSKIKVQTIIFPNNDTGNPAPSTQSPVANAGPDQTLVDSNGNGNEAVTLDASGSSDPDGSITSYKWTKNGNQIASGVNPPLNLAVGTHNITLTVTDNDGQSDTDQVVVYVNEPSNNDSGEGGSDSYCEASGSTISQAKQNFQKACGIKYDKAKGHDCDPDGNGGWVCSTGDVGSSVIDQSSSRVGIIQSSTKGVDSDQEISVSIPENTFEEGDAFSIQQVYPNPIQEVINIRIISQFDDMVSIDLIDQLGRIYLHKDALISKGDNLISVELSQISIDQGVLFLKIGSEKMPLKPIKLLKTLFTF